MTYQVISEILQRHDSDLKASEIHGIASALLCVDQNTPVACWLDEIIDENAGVLEEEQSTLVELFERTRKFLQPETVEFAFDLLLPIGDDLKSNIIAMCQWCEGFLWGIGSINLPDRDRSSETQAILRDMIEFTKLDPYVTEDDDEEEEAFMQIHQYLRAAVLIIRDELLTATPEHF